MKWIAVLLLILSISTPGIENISMTDHIASEYKRKDAPTIVSVASQCANQYNLPIDLVLAIIEVESGFNHKAIAHNCYGLMQVHKIWVPTLVKNGIIEKREDLLNIENNINAGCFILSVYLNGTTINKALDKYKGGNSKNYIKKIQRIRKEHVQYMATINNL